MKQKYCHGCGIHEDIRSEQIEVVCPRCDGKGETLVPRGVQLMNIECDRCKGSGKANETKRYRVCRVCGKSRPY